VSEQLDVFRYISYVRLRWRLLVVSCLAATALALGVIDPPGGSDPRGAMSVSPIYLESLKTYEEFASSDSLFVKALDRFKLRTELGSLPIESLKKRILKASLVRNTRILEISATLPVPRKAQELAQFIAESAADLNTGFISAGDQDLLVGAENQDRQARAEFDRTEAAWSQLLVNEPTDDLQTSMVNLSDLRSQTQEQLLSVELDATGADADLAASARARAEVLRKQIETLDHQAAASEKLLALRMGHRGKLDAERKSATASLAAMDGRMRETRANAGYRGERLRIIDPGIVPERPSSPNVPLNVAAALLLGLALPVLYLALEMNFQEQKVRARRAPGNRSWDALAKTRED
jgi:capsular polysaccharide biosynthesis protein